MNSELVGLGSLLQKHQDNLDAKMKKHEKDLKMNQPHLTHLTDRYE